MTIALCNNQGSMLTRLVDKTLFLHAGREIGVASTKAFTAQLIVLLKLVVGFSQTDWNELRTLSNVYRLPEELDQVCQLKILDDWAADLSKSQAMMILGRGSLYPIAMEAALKLKEIAYKHVHSLPASELKHGSLALIDHECPVIMMIPDDHLLKKNLLTCEEILARNGRLYVLFEETINPEMIPKQASKIALPSTNHLFKAIPFIIPFQLLSLKIATLLQYNVDKPRNLAKSVTVE